MRIQSSVTFMSMILGSMTHFIPTAYANVEDIDECTLLTSDEEYAGGVTAVYDSFCLVSPDDIGCFESSCRRCVYDETLGNSLDYYTCDELSDSHDEKCDANVPSGDRSVGISAQYDEGCTEFGGIGCFPAAGNHTNCRFCAEKLTPQSQHLFLCNDVEYNVTSNVTSRWIGDEEAVCTELVSDGDRANGIDAYYDHECVVKGGLGCSESIATAGCRYCKTDNTTESEQFFSCDRLVNASTVTMQQDACGALVSLYGKSVGVSAQVDDDCADSEDSACFNDMSADDENLSCRYCQYEKTHQSSHLDVCAVRETYFSYCTRIVGPGDRAAGINAYLDLSCESEGLGCFPNMNCRYCREAGENELNSHLDECPRECDNLMEAGDARAMLYAVDEECLLDELENISGCQSGTSCRMCKTRDDGSEDDYPFCQDLATVSTM